MKIEIKAEPIPQPRPRFGRGGKVYQPEKIKAYKNVVSYAAKTAMQGKPPTSEALKINLRFYRRFKASSRRFGDCDNLVKAVLDACNGIIFADDSQIISLTAEKYQGTPRLELEITPI